METVLAPALEVESAGDTRAAAAASEVGAPAFSVLVVAPHELVQYGIRLMLSRECWPGAYASAAGIEAALGTLARNPADIALIDVKLDDETAEQACFELRKAAPRMRRLLLTTSDFIPPRTVASTGADGFVCKGWSSREIADTLQAVGMGRPQVAPRPITDAGLSPRQLEMMQLLADGATNDQIARLLHLSASTVKQHTSAAYRKLGVRNRAAAISRARQLSLI